MDDVDWRQNPEEIRKTKGVSEIVLKSLDCLLSWLKSLKNVDKSALIFVKLGRELRHQTTK